MQWKKNSCGDMPVMYRPTIKPPDFGDVSNALKLGNDLPEIINGGRLPSNSICPKEPEICTVLTEDPLAPDPTINWRLFSGNLQSKPSGTQALKFDYLFRETNGWRR